MTTAVMDDLDPWETIKERFGADDFSLAFARIENHYFTNKGFFPRDGFLIEKQNIDKVRSISITYLHSCLYLIVSPSSPPVDSSYSHLHSAREV